MFSVLCNETRKGTVTGLKNNRIAIYAQLSKRKLRCISWESTALVLQDNKTPSYHNVPADKNAIVRTDKTEWRLNTFNTFVTCTIYIDSGMAISLQVVTIVQVLKSLSFYHIQKYVWPMKMNNALLIYDNCVETIVL